MFSVASPLTRSGWGFAITAAIAAAYAIINIFFAMPKFYHTFIMPTKRHLPLHWGGGFGIITDMALLEDKR